MRRSKFLTRSSISLIAVAVASPTWAQSQVTATATTTMIAQASPIATTTPAAATSTDEATGQLQEIVVTAQKRSENVQKVPISITAIGNAALQQRGIETIADLAGAVPGFQVQEFSGVVLPFLRGVGTTGSVISNEPSVAVYTDGIYYARLPLSFFNLRNIDHVEVLKGPQGTLFGRNSTGGVVNIVTKDPSHETAVMGGIGYGRFDAVETNLYATTGLSSKAAMDITVSANTDNGFGRNLTHNTRYGYSDGLLVRSKLLYEPADGTRFVLAGFYSLSEQSGQKAAFPGTATRSITNLTNSALPQQSFCSTPVPSIPNCQVIGFYNSVSGFQDRDKFEMWGISLRAQHDLPFARLTNIAAYSDLKETDKFSGDYSPRNDFYVPITGQVKLFTEEFQISSLPSSPLTWIAGLYYYNNATGYPQIDFNGPLIFGPAGLATPSAQKSTSIAGFGQATYEILPKLKLTGGVRYTADSTTGSGIIAVRTDPLFILPPAFGGSPPPSTTHNNKVTFKASVDYQVTRSILTYFLFSRGYKSGVYNILPYNSATATKPEELDQYEIGAKSDLFDHHLRLNVALFQYDITNPQVETIQQGTIVFANAGASRVKGVEFDGQFAVSRDLTARLSATFLDSKYTDFRNAPSSIPNLLIGGADPLTIPQAAGNRTPLAAKTTFDIGVDYKLPTSLGDFLLTADYYHNSGYFYEPDNFLHQREYDLVNAQLRYDLTKNTSVRIWGKNLLDVAYSIAATTQVGAAGYPWTPALPRTYGIAFDFKF